MFLKDATGNILDVTQTDSNGDYLFDELPAGTYTVMYLDPIGDAYFADSNIPGPATPNGTAGDGSVMITSIGDITIGLGEHSPDNDFGLIEIIPPTADASLAGTIYHDVEDDDVYIANPELSGYLVTLYDASNTPIDAMFTDSNGDYLFT